jgi:hypothetical protein
VEGGTAGAPSPQRGCGGHRSATCRSGRRAEVLLDHECWVGAGSWHLAAGHKRVPTQAQQAADHLDKNRTGNRAESSSSRERERGHVCWCWPGAGITGVACPGGGGFHRPFKNEIRQGPLHLPLQMGGRQQAAQAEQATSQGLEGLGAARLGARSSGVTTTADAEKNPQRNPRTSPLGDNPVGRPCS